MIQALAAGVVCGEVGIACSDGYGTGVAIYITNIQLVVKMHEVQVAVKIQERHKIHKTQLVVSQNIQKKSKIILVSPGMVESTKSAWWSKYMKSTWWSRANSPAAASTPTWAAV